MLYTYKTANKTNQARATGQVAYNAICAVVFVSGGSLESGTI